MERYTVTQSRGLRAPIFNAGDKLDRIIPELVMEASQKEGFELHDRDVLCITESVVARTQGNYATIDDIRDDLKSQLPADCETLGLIFPISSRNRFSILLRGMAAACPKIVLMMSFPSDEVGNPLFDPRLLYGSGVNPWEDVLSEAQFKAFFGESRHPFTGMNYIDFYREIIEEAGSSCEIIFAIHAKAILDYTKDVVCCDIHTRENSQRELKEAGARTVLALDDILARPSDQHGYNEAYGLLGSNKADDQRVKLFPRNCEALVEKIAERLRELSGKKIEVMIYGDGAFKDPVGKIWELADPVVSPAYTPGLSGTPNELKLKYLADNDLRGLDHTAQEKAIRERIQQKDADLVGRMVSEGTTPRRLTDLLGSLADLTSGSGDKGTPIVLIQGYFDNFAS